MFAIVHTYMYSTYILICVCTSKSIKKFLINSIDNIFISQYFPCLSEKTYRNFTSRIIRKIEKRKKSPRYEMLRKPCEDVVAFIRDEGVEVKRKG